jgi:transposase-like protein
MSGHGSKRPQREEAAIAALLSEPSVDAAAKKIGVSPATLYRWLDEPAFRDRYRGARRQVLDHAVTALQQAASDAVAALREVANDQQQPAPRVSASKAILDQAFRGLETLDLADEIATLKRQMIGDVEDGAGGSAA